MTVIDRRAGRDRRLANQGPPVGMVERRVTMQRRVLDIPCRSFAEWTGQRTADNTAVPGFTVGGAIADVS